MSNLNEKNILTLEIDALHTVDILVHIQAIKLDTYSDSSSNVSELHDIFTPNKIIFHKKASIN